MPIPIREVRTPSSHAQVSSGLQEEATTYTVSYCSETLRSVASEITVDFGRPFYVTSIVSRSRNSISKAGFLSRYQLLYGYDDQSMYLFPREVKAGASVLNDFKFEAYPYLLAKTIRVYPQQLTGEACVDLQFTGCPLSCGGVLTGSVIRISGDRDPSTKTDCVWFIYGNGSNTISIEFRYFEVLCSLGAVEIRSGLEPYDSATVLRRYCKENNESSIERTAVIPSSKMWLRYHAKWTDKLVNFNALIVTNCNMDSIEESGLLLSPGYDLDEAISVSCVWNIRSVEGNYVSLNFEEFDVRDDVIIGYRPCMQNYVEIIITDGDSDNSVGKYCSLVKPGKVIVVESHSVQIKTVFSGTFYRHSYKLSYRSVPSQNVVSLHNASWLGRTDKMDPEHAKATIIVASVYGCLVVFMVIISSYCNIPEVIVRIQTRKCIKYAAAQPITPAPFEHSCDQPLLAKNSTSNSTLKRKVILTASCSKNKKTAVAV